MFRCHPTRIERMINVNFSLGLVEVQSLGHAIAMVDDMLKAADVEFVATERRLGGRLVTVVVRGELSAVKASVEAGKAAASSMGCLKAAEVIANPHPEILKFLHLDEAEKKTAEKAADKPQALKKSTRSKAVSKETASDKESPRKRGRKPKQV